MQKIEKRNSDQMIYDAKIPIRLAYTNNVDVPNVISLWFMKIDDKIYCATQKSAKIISYLKKNPVCGFEIAADKPPYKGVRGNGSAKIIDDMGKNILQLLMKKYLGEKESGLSKFLKNNSHNEVAIEITPKNLFYYDYSSRMKDVS
ncbi:pyridoxamine 5'-phosphate oxidase-related FMN-binding protein [Marine Group I thaumarchaeote SCGC AAA799-B03]|uniref:Pyridoxamine 5'-phosphate oxidase-related FMN-binding protein n=4 Tax=Marine Group I TaxID=905826 RepID=A0A087S863_9ARCH|nr:pyridoxamine 5'-phosphate oxidase-like FMN-binding protein [Marine Group I thaumarchaeote SCGC AAA799-N04]KFM15997.1 pyridoxamine 5'-phosphate oxidase-like FMN-binding protein [Marine Group I thaumarchaeote SCGC AAA799-D11]KFM17734.1 putative pyridoxamine 5\'-phosphate-related protein [Marine Group I thaumarchaeote SCGC RSA3]KFM21917.1 pyridoxamine 5'-phosphate oxidase-related FMN-binding protein [Marine Group I thaumarchaeote SCGC AAA799-B03]